jgi:transcriptional regulator with XRE-family HTH domain
MEILWRGPLRRWRKEAGLTVKEAAERLGISPYRLRQWEARTNGATPSATALATMCEVYGVSRREAFNRWIVQVGG